MTLDPTYDSRAAGEITRYHTWPRLRDQSVGEHSWQVMRILLTVWPECPRRLLVHTVFHDVGEMAGDIPWPFKQTVPELGVGMKKAERMVIDGMVELGTLPPETVLWQPSEVELSIFKICENVEMWEYGLREQLMGNRYAALVSKRMYTAAIKKLNGMMNTTDDTGEVKKVLRKIYEYVRARDRREHCPT